MLQNNFGPGLCSHDLGRNKIHVNNDEAAVILDFLYIVAKILINQRIKVVGNRTLNVVKNSMVELLSGSIDFYD